ncbi:diacylglycerol O-acyltransferase, partial [Streptomyces lasiicapitis]
TYRGRVHYGLVADAAAVPDLDLLARCVRVELAALVAACEDARRVAVDRSGLVPGARAT